MGRKEEKEVNYFLILRYMMVNDVVAHGMTINIKNFENIEKSMELEELLNF